MSSASSVSLFEPLWHKFIDPVLSSLPTNIHGFNTSHMTKYDTLVLPAAFILLVSIVHHGRTWLEDDREYSVYQLFKVKGVSSTPKKSSKKSKKRQSTPTETEQVGAIARNFKEAFNAYGKKVVDTQYEVVPLHKSNQNIWNYATLLAIPLAILSRGIIDVESIIKWITGYDISSIKDPKNSTAVILISWTVLILISSIPILALRYAFYIIPAILQCMAPPLYSYGVFLLLQVIFYYMVSYVPEQATDRLNYFKSLVFTAPPGSGLSNYEFLYREAITHSIAYSFCPLVLGELDGLKILLFYAIRRILRITYDYVSSEFVKACPYIFLLSYIVLALPRYFMKTKKSTNNAILLKKSTNFVPLSKRVAFLVFSVVSSLFISWSLGTLKLSSPFYYSKLEAIGRYLYPHLLDDFCLALAFYAVNFWTPMLSDFEKGLGVAAVETIGDSFFLPFIYGSYKLSKYIRNENPELIDENVPERSSIVGHVNEHTLLRNPDALLSYYNEPNSILASKSPIHSANGTYKLAFGNLQNETFDFELLDNVRATLYKKSFYPILVSNAFLPCLMITLGFWQLVLEKNTRDNLADVSTLDNLVLLAKSLEGSSRATAQKKEASESFKAGLEEFIKRNDPYHELHVQDIKKKAPTTFLAVMYKIFFPIFLIFVSSILIYITATALTFSLRDKTMSSALSWSFDQIFPIFYMFTYACSMPLANSFYHYRHSLGFSENKITRFILSLVPCFGYFFLRRFVRKSFDFFGWARPWTNSHLYCTLLVAIVTSIIYTFGGPLVLLPNSAKMHAGKFAYGILFLAFSFVVYNAKSWAFQDILIAIFDSVAYDIQYTLGYVILNLNSWLPECLGHESLTGLGQALNFGLFEAVAVFSEFKYEKLFSPNTSVTH